MWVHSALGFGHCQRGFVIAHQECREVVVGHRRGELLFEVGEPVAGAPAVELAFVEGGGREEGCGCVVQRLCRGTAAHDHDLPNNLWVVNLQEVGDLRQEAREGQHSAPPVGHAVLAVVADVPDGEAARNYDLLPEHRLPHLHDHPLVDAEDDAQHHFSTELAFGASDVEDTPAEEPHRHAKTVLANNFMDFVLADELSEGRAVRGFLRLPSGAALLDVVACPPIHGRTEHCLCFHDVALAGSKVAKQRGRLSRFLRLAIRHLLAKPAQSLQLVRAHGVGHRHDAPFDWVAPRGGSRLEFQVLEFLLQARHAFHGRIRGLEHVHHPGHVAVAAALEGIGSERLEPLLQQVEIDLPRLQLLHPSARGKRLGAGVCDVPVAP
mmetsp:Transcript_46803/g.130345  ORF Transcript_46803/g.130345 Transcript_46803/m.130345 type:complete len:380 (+) Transcript_46803:183-1322(+)